MKDEKEKSSIIILHGWGLKGSVYKELINFLQKDGRKVYSIDLPGFGSEPLKKQPMSLNNYVDFVNEFIQKNKLKKVVLIGHSFGGRVSIKFTIAFPSKVLGLILTGAPGIKRRLSLLRRIVQYVAITVGEIFRIPLLFPLKQIIRKGLYFIIGEWDYYNAGDLRETFKNVIAENLAFLLPAISVPTLLVWGENDTVVPLRDGKDMQKLMPKAKLVVIKNSGHKLPYEKPKEFMQAIVPFIEKL